MLQLVRGRGRRGFGLSPTDASARRRLAAGEGGALRAREQTHHPAGRHEKSHGLEGLLFRPSPAAARTLGAPDYTAPPRQAARFILRERLRTRTGGCCVHTKTGRQRRKAFWKITRSGQGLFDLYEASWEEEWLLWAQELVSQALDLFAAEEGAGFFMTAKDAEALLHRPRDLRDQSMPSGTAILLRCLVRLESLEHDAQRRRLVDRALGAVGPRMKAQPWGAGRLGDRHALGAGRRRGGGLAAPPGGA